MKVTNWLKTLSAAIVAAGIWVPSAALAVNIPLGDPSFENYVVPARGYAYATGSLGTYRPTSPWVDDLDMFDALPNPPGYAQDDPNSNWLYNTTYADANGRGAPRTGNQALHGHHNYTAQELTEVFQAGSYYTFSIWAQNDVLLNDQNGAFLYIFDADLPFSDGAALAGSGAITAINKRVTGMTTAQSQANWTQISVSYLMPPGSPSDGHHIGVGFFARRDTAFDDATLTSVPEPASIILVGMGGLSFVAFRRRR